MKYSALASSKKKKLLKKLKAGTTLTAATLPTKPMTVTMENVRATVTGEHFIRDFQYPQTIRNLMRDLEITKFEMFLESLSKHPFDLKRAFDLTSGADYPTEGCLRWIYDNRFFNDGQERYEAADDVSFDVRGNFCYRCEMARRLVELRPIAFEAPDPNNQSLPEFITEGFTNKDWTWIDEPATEQCSLVSIGEEQPETRSGNFVCELSKDLFQTLLTMIQSTSEYRELRDVATSYRCGNRRVFVTEAIPNKPSAGNKDGGLDYQMDIVKSIRELATPRKLNDRGVEVSIIVSEINPFMIDDSEINSYMNECFYSPRLVVNQWSKVIHSMTIQLNMGLGGASYLFVCPEFPLGTVDYQITRTISTFPDNDIYYPAMFYGRGHLSEIILYSVMYLMERSSAGDFSRVVNENPEEFYKICRRGLSPPEAEFYRKRLVIHKRNDRLRNYPSMLKAIRSCFSGLSVHKQP